jgi:xylulokinase
VLDLAETDGSEGAARGAGIGAGVYDRPADATGQLALARRVEPAPPHTLDAAYARWRSALDARLSRP